MKLIALALLSLAASAPCLAQNRAAQLQEICRNAADLRTRGDTVGAMTKLLQVYTYDDSAVQQGDCKTLAAAFPLNGYAHLLVSSALLLDDNNLDRASTEYEKALSVPGEMDSPLAYVHVGKMLNYFSSPDKALASFREAARLQPESAEAHAEIGNLLAKRGDARGAATEYRLAIKSSPDRAMPHEKLGRVLIVTGDSEQAMREFARARELDSGYADIVQKDLTRVQNWNREMESKAKYRDAALHDPKALGHYLGFFYSADFAEQRGDYDQAVADWRRAMSMLHPKEEDNVLRTRLAYTLWLKGDLSGAIAEYEPLRFSNGDDSSCTFQALVREKKDMVGPLQKDLRNAFAYNLAARNAGSQGGEGMVANSSCPEDGGLRWFQDMFVDTF